MSKFYADENIRLKMVKEMRAKDLDVQTSPEANNDGITDPEQLDYATNRDSFLWRMNLAYSIHNQDRSKSTLL